MPFLYTCPGGDGADKTCEEVFPWNMPHPICPGGRDGRCGRSTCSIPKPSACSVEISRKSPSPLNGHGAHLRKLFRNQNPDKKPFPGDQPHPARAKNWSTDCQRQYPLAAMIYRWSLICLLPRPPAPSVMMSMLSRPLGVNLTH
jgi:hypothetical protein